MTIAVAVTVSDGIVLAADSRQTYTNVRDDVRVSSDYAHKTFQLTPYAGAVTWGWAFLLGRNIHSHVNDYKKSLTNPNMAPEDLAKGLGAYLQSLYVTHIKKGYNDPVEKDDYAVGLLLAGYEPVSGLGQLYEIYIPEGEVLLRNDTGEDFGAVWRGQTTHISRLVKGCDPRIRDVAGFSKKLNKTLNTESPLDYNMNYRVMPLQDAIDYATFLVHVTVQAERFTDGIVMAPGSSNTCGGPIDVMVVEPEHGFHWIQHKTLQGERPSQMGINGG